MEHRASALTIMALSAALLAVPSAASAADPPAPVASVDVPRYLGSWYQVAAVPALYEIQCLKNATAHYTLTPAGTVGVKNGCRSIFNIKSTIKGDAKPLDASNARLNVSFLGYNGVYAHSSDANYIVIGLDPDYRWAVVTDSDRVSGFVLSRTPALGTAEIAKTRNALTAAGVDPCALRFTPQDGGVTTRDPYC